MKIIIPYSGSTSVSVHHFTSYFFFALLSSPISTIRLARFQFLSFFIGSFGTAPTAYFFRNLMVKERSQIQIAAILISGITGVSCAYHGWGYWGIAVQTVVYVSTKTILSLATYFFVPLSPIAGIIAFQQ